MNDKINNFLNSGYTFDKYNFIPKGKYRITNIMLSIYIFGLTFGILNNIFTNNEKFFLIIIESVLISLSFLMIFLLRKKRSNFYYVQNIFLFEFTIFFNFLFYVSNIYDMKFLWLYLYPLLLLSLQQGKRVLYWFSFMIILLVIIPLQNIISVTFTLQQMLYIIMVFIIETIIVYFYHIQMSTASETITSQNIDIQRKYKELSKKDSMLTAQSKQAVMGEMMSMIAHQWRQPLSTVTLNISNIQFKIMLGQELSDEDLNKALSEISDTVVYLSDTVDDFQTFFHPKKEKGVIEIHELLQKAVNFATPRTKEHKIEITVNKYIEIEVVTYVNELVQIMLNILNNAIDALESAKKDSPKIIIYVELKGEYIYISIVDNANGIPDEILDNVFDPYFSTKGKNGTGLGLYMSQMLAQKQFDGEITFTSSSLGTHFLVKVKKDISS